MRCSWPISSLLAKRSTASQNRCSRVSCFSASASSGNGFSPNPALPSPPLSPSFPPSPSPFPSPPPSASTVSSSPVQDGAAGVVSNTCGLTRKRATTAPIRSQRLSCIPSFISALTAARSGMTICVPQRVTNRPFCVLVTVHFPCKTHTGGKVEGQQPQGRGHDRRERRSKERGMCTRHD